MEDNNKVAMTEHNLLEAFALLESTRLEPLHCLKVIIELIVYKRFNDSPGIKNSVFTISENKRWPSFLDSKQDRFFHLAEDNLRDIFKSSSTLKRLVPIIELRKYNSFVNPQIQEEIFNLYSQLDLSSNGLDEKNIIDILDRLFNNTSLAFRRTRRRSEYLITPDLDNFIIRLLSPKRHERFFVPQFGTGQIFLKYLKYVREQNDAEPSSKGELKLRGFEKNREGWEICTLVALLVNMETVHIEHQDYLSTEMYEVLSENYLKKIPNEDEKKKITAYLQTLSSTERGIKKRRKVLLKEFESGTEQFLSHLFRSIDVRADVTVVNPPFSIRIPSGMPVHVEIEDKVITIPPTRSELYYLLLTFRNLNEQGRMAVILPTASLSRGDETRKIWKYLCDSDCLEAIFPLPERLLPYAIPVILVILNKKKSPQKKNKVAFIPVKKENGAPGIQDKEIVRIKNMYDSFRFGDGGGISATIEDIQLNDYNLSPSYYLEGVPAARKQLIEENISKNLGNICQVISGRYRNVPASANHIGGIPFITTKDLAKDVTEPKLKSQDILYSSAGSQGYLTNINDLIKEKCILVSLVGRDIKPTIYEPSDYKHGIVAGHNVAILIPDQKVVDFEYLYYQLYTPLVKKQYEAFHSGAGVPSLSIQNLKSIIIPLPDSFDVQRSIASQHRSLLLQAEYRRHQSIVERLQGRYRKQEAEFSIVRHLAHNIKPKIHIAKSPISSLKHFLKDRELLGEVLSKRLDGTNETISEALEQSIQSLDQIADVLDSCKKLVVNEIKKSDFVEVEMCHLFEKVILPIYKNKPYNIDLHCNVINPVQLHKESFIEAINNLIKNAEDHAFRDRREGAELRFELNESNDDIVIDYTNNGLPFPKSMSEKDFLTFGRKRADSSGDGLGGAWIGKVLEAHNATFEIIHDKNPLHFRITLPRSNE